MDDLEQAIGRTIKRLLANGERVIVAVSGGVDSMVLLRLLHELAKNRGWKLFVAHFNHRLRGKSSDADQQFVRRAAGQLALPFVTDSADVRKMAAIAGISIEMAARNARHEFLARCAKKFRAKKIAMAHHADDQLELFFLRLFRGSGSAALAGMKWRNSSPANGSVQLIRPLLAQSKRQLAAYARKAKIQFREDATNQSAEFQRNRIRLELIPLLRNKYQPALESAVARILEIVGSESEMVKEAATSWLRKSIKPRGADTFDILHVAVQRQVIQLQLEHLGIVPSFELVEKLRSTPGSDVSVRLSSDSGFEPKLTKSPGNASLCVSRNEKGRIEVKTRAATQFDGEVIRIGLEKAQTPLRFGGLRLEWRVQTRRGTKIPSCRPGQESFDSEKVGNEIILRHWQPGDRFQPIGSSKPVKLQDFFINEKFPRARRHELVLACTEKGDIFWVEGLRVSERFKLTDQTNRRLQWRWKRL
jgi:tRNA(Ile)-lysidine synthase